MREYTNTEHCPNCNMDTLHNIIDSQHERDSSRDNRTCKRCGWRYSGLTGEYAAPSNEKKYTWTKEEVEKLTESAFKEGIEAGENILALPTPRVRYNEWKSKNL